MTLREWFSELEGVIEDLPSDPELFDAHQAYVCAYSELIHILNKRGFDIEPEYGKPSYQRGRGV